MVNVEGILERNSVPVRAGAISACSKELFCRKQLLGVVLVAPSTWDDSFSFADRYFSAYGFPFLPSAVVP